MSDQRSPGSDVEEGTSDGVAGEADGTVEQERDATRLDDRSSREGGHEDKSSRDGESDGEVADENLRARLRRLEEENDRLRREYVGARESQYGRTALGLAVVGLGFGLAGFVVTSAQEILFTLAATGLFGAVLTRFLTPETFIPLDIGEGIYATFADNEASLASQLGLSGARVYLTTERGPRLFVPEVEAYDRSLLDVDGELANPLVVGEGASRSGLSVRPAGEPLLRAFEKQYRRDLPATPSEAVPTFEEGVTDALELAVGVDSDFDAGAGRATFEFREQLFGSPTRFDHPIGSFLGTGLATALDTPVEVDVKSTRRDETTMFVTCRWDPEAVGESDGDDAQQ